MAKEWDNTFGGADKDFGDTVQETTDGGYIIAGSSFSFDSPDNCDILLIKTDSQGKVKFTLSTNEWIQTYFFNFFIRLQQFFRQ
jgi:hypothetical protein